MAVRFILGAVLTLGLLAVPASAEETGKAMQCTPVNNSAGQELQYCKPDDGAVADIGPAEGQDPDGVEPKAACAAPNHTYTVVCPTDAGTLGAPCSCKDPNTGESAQGSVTNVGIDEGQ